MQSHLSIQTTKWGSYQGWPKCFQIRRWVCWIIHRLFDAIEGPYELHQHFQCLMNVIDDLFLNYHWLMIRLSEMDLKRVISKVYRKKSAGAISTRQAAVLVVPPVMSHGNKSPTSKQWYFQMVLNDLNLLQQINFCQAWSSRAYFSTKESLWTVMDALVLQAANDYWVTRSIRYWLSNAKLFILQHKVSNENWDVLFKWGHLQ